VKIDRVQLIERVESEIRRLKDGADARLNQAEVDEYNRQERYIHDTKADWTKVADNIRRRVRLGQPVTIADIPESLHYRYDGTVEVFKPKKIDLAQYVAQTGYLENLLVVLKSSPDEFVTDSSLARLGVPLKNLVGR
jgi:hypothetical protein